MLQGGLNKCCLGIAKVCCITWSSSVLARSCLSQQASRIAGWDMGWCAGRASGTYAYIDCLGGVPGVAIDGMVILPWGLVNPLRFLP